ncbi:MAG: Hypothetical protein AJITA_00877 [Acetilactobacillus jinshanensis]
MYHDAGDNKIKKQLKIIIIIFVISSELLQIINNRKRVFKFLILIKFISYYPDNFELTASSP